MIVAYLKAISKYLPWKIDIEIKKDGQMIRRHEQHKGLLRPAPNASVLSRQIESMSSSKGGQTFSRGQQMSAQFTSQGKCKLCLATPSQLVSTCVTALHVRLETREPLSLGPVLNNTLAKC